MMRPPQSLRGGQFEARNISVHGISWPAVSRQPTFAQWHPHLVTGLADDLLVAHNAAFDRDVLTKASAAVGLHDVPNPWLCTRDLSRRYLNLPGYRRSPRPSGLPAFDHHDALADSRACARVLIAMVHLHPDLLGTLPLRTGAAAPA